MKETEHEVTLFSMIEIKLQECQINTIQMYNFKVVPKISDRRVKIQRYSFFEILEIILHSCNVNHHVYIPYTFFWVALLSPNVSILPRTCNYNSLIRV